MTSMLDRVQGMVTPAVTQQPLSSSQDLSQPSGANFHDSQNSHLEAELQVVDSMPNIPYVQSINRDYREALDSVFEVLSDKISRPSVQNHDPEDCSNKPSKLSYARYKPMASDVWSDLLKDPVQGSGLPSPKKEIYLSRNVAHALERSLRSDLMILNSLDFFREALSVNHTSLVKLVDQSESNLSLDTQQALDVNSLLINQVKFHLIDLLASVTHSISTLTLARRDSFLSTVPKHVPDHMPDHSLVNLP